MRAAVLEALLQPLVMRDLPEPDPTPDGAVVRVEACGICRTDWHLWKGHWSWLGVELDLPLVLGHEFAGVVEEVGGEVTRFTPGDRVIAPFYYADGACRQCQQGLHNLCEAPAYPGASQDGAFSRWTHVPGADLNLVALPESVDFREAAIMGCRFVTAFHGLVDQARIRPGEWVAVFGCGGVGLSAITIASAIGAQVVAVDIDDAKLDKAKEVGAHVGVNSASIDAVEALQEVTGGGPHVTVDALGIADTVTSAILSLRARGRHVQIGLTTAIEAGQVAVPIDLIVARELRIVGTFGMPLTEYDAVLGLVTGNGVDLSRLLSHTVSIGDAGSVLESMSRYETVGTVVIDSW